MKFIKGLLSKSSTFIHYLTKSFGQVFTGHETSHECCKKVYLDKEHELEVKQKLDLILKDNQESDKKYCTCSALDLLLECNKKTKFILEIALEMF